MKYLIGLVVVLGVCAAAGAAWLQRGGVEKLMKTYLEQELGTEVRFESLAVDWRNTQFHIKNLEIANPSGFPEGSTMIISNLFADIEIRGLLEWQFTVEDLEIDVREVRALDLGGQGLNLHGLQIFETPAPAVAEKTGARKRFPHLVVLKLVVRMNHMTVTDLKNERPSQRSVQFESGEAVFENLNGFDEIGRTVVWLALKNGGLLQEPENAAPETVSEAASA